jgi:hypothetical protein
VKLSDAVACKLLGDITVGKDERGYYAEYDKVVIALRPIPGCQNVQFFMGSKLIGGMDILMLADGDTLSLSGIEGRMRFVAT